MAVTEGLGMRTVLITGTAGFIGFHLARALLSEGFRVVGYDGMTPYYDVALKRARQPLAGSKSSGRKGGNAATRATRRPGTRLIAPL